MNSPPFVILSAPSGTGKSSVIKELLRKRSDLEFSISSTTRTPRKYEKDGEHYYFLSKEIFQKEIEKDSFLEWAAVLNNFYGTKKSEITRIQKKGKIPIMDVDVQGALNLKKRYPNSIISIFLLPPSLEILKNRLQKRSTETIESLERRLKLAEEEMLWKNYYDFQIINDKLNSAVSEISNIIDSQLK